MALEASCCVHSKANENMSRVLDTRKGHAKYLCVTNFFLRHEEVIRKPFLNVCSMLAVQKQAVKGGSPVIASQGCSTWRVVTGTR